MSARRHYFYLYGSAPLDVRCIQAIEASDSPPEYIRFLVSLGFTLARISEKSFTQAFNEHFERKVDRLTKNQYLLRSGPYKVNVQPTNAYEECFGTISAKSPSFNRQEYIRKLLLMGFWFETLPATNSILPFYHHQRHEQVIGQPVVVKAKSTSATSTQTNAPRAKDAMRNLM